MDIHIAFSSESRLTSFSPLQYEEAKGQSASLLNLYECHSTESGGFSMPVFF